MSGTSADGLSIALCVQKGHTLKVLAYQTTGYPEEFRKIIHNASQLKTSQISSFHYRLGKFYAQKTAAFLKRHKVPPSKIKVIGSHGQTLYHGAKDRTANTFQIGEASFIAEATGIPVVSDFRTRDMAAGGQGAPLIPFFDDYFFARSTGRALQNIGGIANVTFVKKGSAPLAFDNGPGNTLIDLIVRKATKGKTLFDRNGLMAKRGRIDHKIVRQMTAHPYFKTRPPKSTGLELFNEKWIPKSLKRESWETQIATLTYFTAYTIFQSYQWFAPFKIHEIILSGGGALNRTLTEHLASLFAPITVKPISDYGIHVQAKEPAAFGFFALRALEGKINHLPQGTGASHACVLGKITR